MKPEESDGSKSMFLTVLKKPLNKAILFISLFVIMLGVVFLRVPIFISGITAFLVSVCIIFNDFIITGNKIIENNKCNKDKELNAVFLEGVFNKLRDKVLYREKKILMKEELELYERLNSLKIVFEKEIADGVFDKIESLDMKIKIESLFSECIKELIVIIDIRSLNYKLKSRTNKRSTNNKIKELKNQIRTGIEILENAIVFQKVSNGICNVNFSELEYSSNELQKNLNVNEKQIE